VCSVTDSRRAAAAAAVAASAAASQRFETLRAAQAAPRHAMLPDVLLLLTSAAEFGWVKLRRDEKALMKARRMRFERMIPAAWDACAL
jgi:hypothetical protein